jgi:hypothetical protein
MTAVTLSLVAALPAISFVPLHGRIAPAAPAYARVSNVRAYMPPEACALVSLEPMNRTDEPPPGSAR